MAAYHPQVVADSQGNALIVWVPGDNGPLDLKASRFTAAGWEPTQDVGLHFDARPPPGSSAPAPRLGKDGNGNAVIVWSGRSYAQPTIQASFYPAASGWRPMGTLNPKTVLLSRSPALAVNAAGAAIAVWEEQVDARLSVNPATVYSALFLPSRGWLPAVPMHPRNAHLPQVALDPAGDAVATWVEQEGDAWAVWASRFVHTR